MKMRNKKERSKNVRKANRQNNKRNEEVRRGHNLSPSPSGKVNLYSASKNGSNYCGFVLNYWMYSYASKILFLLLSRNIISRYNVFG